MRPYGGLMIGSPCGPNMRGPGGCPPRPPAGPPPAAAPAPLPPLAPHQAFRRREWLGLDADVVGVEGHLADARSRRDVQHAGFRIGGAALPVRAAGHVRQHQQRRAGRSVPATIGGVKSGPSLYSGDHLQRFGPQLRREVDQIVERDALTIERRRLGRERLRRRRFARPARRTAAPAALRSARPAGRSTRSKT